MEAGKNNDYRRFQFFGLARFCGVLRGLLPHFCKNLILLLNDITTVALFLRKSLQERREKYVDQVSAVSLRQSIETRTASEQGTSQQS